MKKVFKLGYIHCAGCSVALQDKISKVEGVNSAEINFVSKIVTIDIENKNSKQIIQNVYDAVHEFDKSIEILAPDAHEKTKKSDIIGYYLLGASILLWLLGITLEYTLGLIYVHLPIYIVVYLLIAYDVLLGAVKNIIKGKVLDETFLMSIATIGAFIIGEYLEGCAVMIFYTIGEIFQYYASTKSENRIKSLAGLTSQVANLVNDNGDIMVVELESVCIGDKIQVNAGDKVPLDGKIISGGANFNTAAITGESVGKYYKEGDEILSGYIAEDSSVIVEITTDASSCTVSKIVKMVEEASASKANTEKFISKFARIYTPVVVGLALAICFVMPAFWGYSKMYLNYGHIGAYRFWL